MRVKIGPYTNYLGPYQIANAVFFWIPKHVLDDAIFERWDYKLRDKFGDWLAETWVQDFCQWIDSKKKRKVDIRIDYYDTWSMDNTLAHIIHPMLVQLKKTNHGYFHSDPEDVPSIGKGEKTEWGYGDTNEEKRYDWIMDELIWTFEQIKNDSVHELFYDEKTRSWDREGQNKYEERIANGLRLFGKYYRNLWD